MKNLLIHFLSQRQILLRGMYIDRKRILPGLTGSARFQNVNFKNRSNLKLTINQTANKKHFNRIKYLIKLLKL